MSNENGTWAFSWTLNPTTSGAASTLAGSGSGTLASSTGAWATSGWAYTSGSCYCSATGSGWIPCFFFHSSKVTLLLGFSA